MRKKKDTTEDFGSSNCSSSRHRKIQLRLNTLAKKVQELHDILREEFPEYPASFVYFEADGSIHAMARVYVFGESLYPVIASSPTCNFDCGAW